MLGKTRVTVPKSLMEGFSGAGALELEGNYNLYWDSERGVWSDECQTSDGDVVLWALRLLTWR